MFAKTVFISGDYLQFALPSALHLCFQGVHVFHVQAKVLSHFLTNKLINNKSTVVKKNVHLTFKQVDPNVAIQNICSVIDHRFKIIMWYEHNFFFVYTCFSLLSFCVF